MSFEPSLNFGSFEMLETIQASPITTIGLLLFGSLTAWSYSTRVFITSQRLPQPSTISPLPSLTLFQIIGLFIATFFAVFTIEYGLYFGTRERLAWSWLLLVELFMAQHLSETSWLIPSTAKHLSWSANGLLQITTPHNYVSQQTQWYIKAALAHTVAVGVIASSFFWDCKIAHALVAIDFMVAKTQKGSVSKDTAPKLVGRLVAYEALMIGVYMVVKHSLVDFSSLEVHTAFRVASDLLKTYAYAALFMVPGQAVTFAFRYDYTVAERDSESVYNPNAIPASKESTPSSIPVLKSLPEFETSTCTCTAVPLGMLVGFQASWNVTKGQSGMWMMALLAVPVVLCGMLVSVWWNEEWKEFWGHEEVWELETLEWVVDEESSSYPSEKLALMSETL